MDNPVLMVEAPILDDESAMLAHQFLTDLALTYEAYHYK